MPHRAARTILPVLLVFGCGDAAPALTTSEESTSSATTSDTTGTPLVMTEGETTSGTTGPGDETTDASTTTTTGSTTDEPAPTYGLRGEYWATYLDLAIERIDTEVDHDWMMASPGEGLAADRFSIRWTGALLPPETGTYTLITETDDGVRVWVDDELVIDDWNGHFVTRNEAQVALTAGTPAKLRIDYFEIDLAASARLKWSSPTIAEEVVPRERLAAADGPSGLPPPKPPFTNPVELFDCPDPGVLAVADGAGPKYYKVCTGGKFKIRQSRDLILWSDTGAVILPDGKPSWAANGGRNWAPELHVVGGQYVAYFTTVNANDALCIGAATASDPLGPYTESAGPLLEHPLGVIDATYFERDGTPFLIYKLDGNAQNQPTPILVRELTPDGLGFAGDGKQVLVNDINTWEGGVIEAPWVVARDGCFYLFYSGNVYDHRYRTGVARASDLFGPYEKFGPPLLKNNNDWVGPGHGSVVSVGDDDYFIYHAWMNDGQGMQDDGKGRRDLVDRITWVDGWPKISDGSPSASPQPWPGEF